MVNRSSPSWYWYSNKLTRRAFVTLWNTRGEHWSYCIIPRRAADIAVAGWTWRIGWIHDHRWCRLRRAGESSSRNSCRSPRCSTRRSRSRSGRGRRRDGCRGTARDAGRLGEGQSFRRQKPLRCTGIHQGTACLITPNIDQIPSEKAYDDQGYCQ